MARLENSERVPFDEAYRRTTLDRLVVVEADRIRDCAGGREALRPVPEPVGREERHGLGIAGRHRSERLRVAAQRLASREAGAARWATRRILVDALRDHERGRQHVAVATADDDV